MQTKGFFPLPFSVYWVMGFKQAENELNLLFYLSMTKVWVNMKHLLS